MLSQKQAVTNAVKSIFPDYELGGEVILADIMNGDHKKEARAILVEGFKAGEIVLSEAAQAKFLTNEAELNKYVSGLLNNWVRKNKEFNNGNAYQPDPAKAGTRAGGSDPQIKALRALKKTTNDAQAISEIDDAIKARLAEIKPATVVEINVDALPEHLRHLVN